MIVGLAEFDDMVVCQITSKRFGSRIAVPLSTADFKTGSIIVDSFIRPDKLATLDVKMVYQTLGQLGSAKLDEVKRRLDTIFTLD